MDTRITVAQPGVLAFLAELANAACPWDTVYSRYGTKSEAQRFRQAIYQWRRNTLAALREKPEENLILLQTTLGPRACTEWLQYLTLRLAASAIDPSQYCIQANLTRPLYGDDPFLKQLETGPSDEAFMALLQMKQPQQG